MTFVLEIKTQANLDIIDAYNYYEQKKTGLGDEFLDHLESYFNRIIANPKHFPQKRKPYREAFIKRFPYLIIYEVFSKQIIIYAVFNSWQSPGKK